MIIGMAISPASIIIQPQPVSGEAALDWVSWIGSATGGATKFDPPTAVDFSIVINRLGECSIVLYNSATYQQTLLPTVKAGTDLVWADQEGLFDSGYVGKNYDIRMYLREVGGVFTSFEVIGTFTIPNNLTPWNGSGSN